MVGRRPGRTNLGCLLTLLLAVAAVYFAVNVGEPYVRYYRYLDGMKQEARFSARFTDEEIQRRLGRARGFPWTAGGGRSRARAESIEPYFALDILLRARRDAADRPRDPVLAASRVDLLSDRDPARKVMSWESLAQWRQRQRGRVVFTNGVFDLLHPGHVDVLVGARECGDALVVGVNSDASVKRLKGPERPVRSEAERAYVLAALEAVDAVAIFEEDTPLELVRTLQPDVIVKGGDYSPDTVVGAAEVQARGGTVVIIPLTPGHSTTSTIERLRGYKQRT